MSFSCTHHCEPWTTCTSKALATEPHTTATAHGVHATQLCRAHPLSQLSTHNAGTAWLEPPRSFQPPHPVMETLARRVPQLPPAQPRDQSRGAARPGRAPGSPSPRGWPAIGESIQEAGPLAPKPRFARPPLAAVPGSIALPRAAAASSSPTKTCKRGRIFQPPPARPAPTLRDRQGRGERRRAGSSLPRVPRPGSDPSAGLVWLVPVVSRGSGAVSPGHAWRGGGARAKPGQGETPSSPQPRGLGAGEHGWGGLRLGAGSPTPPARALGAVTGHGGTGAGAVRRGVPGGVAGSRGE